MSGDLHQAGHPGIEPVRESVGVGVRAAEAPECEAVDLEEGVGFEVVPFEAQRMGSWLETGQEEQDAGGLTEGRDQDLPSHVLVVEEQVEFEGILKGERVVLFAVDFEHKVSGLIHLEGVVEPAGAFPGIEARTMDGPCAELCGGGIAGPGVEQGAFGVEIGDGWIAQSLDDFGIVIDAVAIGIRVVRISIGVEFGAVAQTVAVWIGGAVGGPDAVASGMTDGDGC